MLETLGIFPELSKDYIFKYITEEDIFCKYLGISSIPDKTKYICNPLREDDYATCSFITGYDGRLRFTDWNGFTAKGRFKGWDCFDLVEYVINNEGGYEISYVSSSTGEVERRYIQLSINSYNNIIINGISYKLNKLSFRLVLEHIAKQFKIHKYSTATTSEQLHLIKADKTPNTIRKERVTINIQGRNWNNSDVSYWNKYYVNLQDNEQVKKMFYFCIYPIEYAWIDGHLYYSYNKKDRCYAYLIDKDGDKNIIQLYFVDRERGNRFRTNASPNTIFGLRQFIPQEIGIITKAYKDIRILNNFKINNEPIFAISAPSETTAISHEQWLKLKYHCDYWITLFDYDYAGIRLALQYWRDYRITPLFFKHQNIGARQVHKLVDEFGLTLTKYILKDNDKRTFNRKDFSDNLSECNPEIMQNLINEMYENFISQ
jgi:hypothetical protein